MMRICIHIVSVLFCISDCSASNLREYEVDKKTFREKCIVKDGEVVLHDWEFVDRKSIYELRLPWSLRIIGTYACAGINITEIILPEGLRIMKNHCFEGCTYLNKISIPSTIEEIGCRAFARTAIKSLIIPKKIKKIGGFELALEQSIKLPDKSKRILSNFLVLILYKERNINLLVVPFAVSKVSRNGFIPFVNYLESIIFENPSTEMEENCLKKCTKLATVSLLEYTTYITPSGDDEPMENIMVRWNDMHKEQWRNKVLKAGVNITTYSGLSLSWLDKIYSKWHYCHRCSKKVRVIPIILIIYEQQFQERWNYVHPDLYKMYFYLFQCMVSQSAEYQRNVLKILPL